MNEFVSTTNLDLNVVRNEFMSIKVKAHLQDQFSLSRRKFLYILVEAPLQDEFDTRGVLFKGC